MCVRQYGFCRRPVFLVLGAGAINMARMLICLPANQTLPGKSNPDCKKSSAAQHRPCLLLLTPQKGKVNYNYNHPSYLSYARTKMSEASKK